MPTSKRWRNTGLVAGALGATTFLSLGSDIGGGGTYLKGLIFGENTTPTAEEATKNAKLAEQQAKIERLKKAGVPVGNAQPSSSSSSSLEMAPKESGASTPPRPRQQLIEQTKEYNYFTKVVQFNGSGESQAYIDASRIIIPGAHSKATIGYQGQKFEKGLVTIDENTNLPITIFFRRQ